MRIQQGYSQGTAGVQSGYSRGTVGVKWVPVGGTVVVGGSIKVMQKLVHVFYIYCNIEPRTSTT